MGQFIKGQVLVELLVAFGLTTIIIPVVFIGLISSAGGKTQSMERIKALSLLKESEEAVRIFREADWTVFAVNGSFHPQKSGNSWTLVSGSQDIDGFTRIIEIEDAQRDENSTLIESGGVVDPSTKKVTLTVSWGGLPNDRVTKTYYMTRYLDNLTWTQTTQAEFDLGTKNGTATTNTSGGEVQLGAGGYGDWCSPNLSIQALDLPKSGVANAITAIEGSVFVGTGDNSSGISFAKIAITNTDPPTGTMTASFDGFKTNGVFGDGSYGYLATDSNSKEIEIVDLNRIVSGKYQEAGYFNAPGNGNGTSVYVSGNYGYMTTSSGDKLFNFNKPGASLPIDTDGILLNHKGNKVFVVGNYAYVATNGTDNQLLIIDISNPSNFVKVKGFTVPGQEGIDLYVNSTGTRVYLVTKISSTAPEFFIIDVSNKSSPRVVGSYDGSGTSPKGVTVVPGNKAILVGIGGSQQYQVIDISDETHPVHCTSGGKSGGLSVATGVNGISSVLESDGDAYSYIIRGDAGSELKIIEGGPGGQFATSGTFESSIFSLGTETAFNRFLVNFSEGTGTDIKFQVAVADQISGSCSGANYSFVGPGGSGSAYFEDDGPIYFDNNGIAFENPGKCFKYKAFFTTTDLNATPVLYDFTVNYSP